MRSSSGDLVSARRHTGNYWPDDIWVEVFSKLHREGLPTNSFGRLPAWQIKLVQSDIRSCSRLKLQLRLVCKRFKGLVDQCQPFTACLAIDKNLGSKSVPSLIRYLKGSGPFIRQFLACCQSPVTELAATAMLSSAAQLEKAIILNTSSSMPGILSAFDTLKTCDLCTTAGNPVNLEPLHALPNLSRLHLCDGPFHDIHSLRHLSALVLWRARLTAHDWQAVSNLRHLKLVFSSWSGLQSGLTACTALTNLVCLESAVTAYNQEERFDLGDLDSYPHLPDGFSTLTQLSVLSLEFRGQRLVASDSWMYMLCNLVELSLNFSAGSFVNKVIGNRLTRLRRLESILLDLGAHSNLLLDVSWQHMFALQHACFYASLIGVSEGIQGLSQLEGLYFLRFDCHDMDTKSAGLLKTFLQDLAVATPPVHCRVQGQFVPKLRWHCSKFAKFVDSTRQERSNEASRRDLFALRSLHA